MVTPLQQSARSAGMADFESMALQASCKPLNRDGRHLLGGLALYEAPTGYTSGLFFSQVLTQEFMNQAINSTLARNDHLSNYRVVPPRLQAITAELPTDNQDKLRASLHQSILAVIARALPAAQTLRNELGTAPISLPRPEPIRPVSLVSLAS